MASCCVGGVVVFVALVASWHFVALVASLHFVALVLSLHFVALVCGILAPPQGYICTTPFDVEHLAIG